MLILCRHICIAGRACKIALKLVCLDICKYRGYNLVQFVFMCMIVLLMSAVVTCV